MLYLWYHRYNELNKDIIVEYIQLHRYGIDYDVMCNIIVHIIPMIPYVLYEL
jgi:hypothetical protein